MLVIGSYIVQSGSSSDNDDDDDDDDNDDDDDEGGSTSMTHGNTILKSFDNNSSQYLNFIRPEW
jgi:hypothetical protein